MENLLSYTVLSKILLVNLNGNSLKSQTTFYEELITGQMFLIFPSHPSSRMLPKTLICNPNDLSYVWFYLNCANLISITACLEFLLTLPKFTAAEKAHCSSKPQQTLSSFPGS